MDICDAFCGVGGFSSGAMAAGCTVILGIDSDKVPLQHWAANTKGSAIRATIGSDEIDWPDARPDLHVHLSPPCTNLSKARAGRMTECEKNDALSMLRWCIDLVLRKKYDSWSLETVSTPETVRVFEELALAHRECVAFSVVDAADYGSPQNRLRIIASTPSVIQNLEQVPVCRISVSDAFEANGVILQSQYFRSNTKKRNGSACVRSVHEQSFTVTASHPLTWTDRAGYTNRCFTVAESACLMGFQKDWILPPGSRKGQKAVGNSVPVQLSRAIMQAAIDARNSKLVSRNINKLKEHAHHDGR